MLATAHSFGITGLNAHDVTIEVDVSRGLPAMTIVGLPDSAVRESKERVRAAIRNAGFEFPPGRITVNLAPADLKKEGPGFDLAIALGVLAASQKIPLEALNATPAIGELSLNGQIAAIPGALACAMACDPARYKGLIVPRANANEAFLARKIPVYPFDNLASVAAFLSGQETVAYEALEEAAPPANPEEYPDFAEVRGQRLAKRGLEVAAAGGHNALLIGPPGSGKSMLAKRLPGILPPLTREEALEVTRIRSLATTGCARALAEERPFRSPHHNTSPAALVGGGTDPRPGEVTLAHHGVLFLDELPEFPRGVLEALRQPLEDGVVTVARAARTLRFPTRFMLLAAMNPCPCGNLMDPRKKCRCPSTEVVRYLSRLSGPLLDRIDLHLEMPALSPGEIGNSPDGESSSVIRARTTEARERQTSRFGQGPVFTNAQMTPSLLRRHCALGSTCRDMLHQAMSSLGFSARAHDKILKVARTISDLAGSEKISAEHLAEAIGYRCLDKIKN